MKTKIAIIAAILAPFFVMWALQDAIAQVYKEVDDDRIVKVIAEKRQQPHLANYIIRFCPDDRVVVDTVLLHSDVETRILGVHKVVEKDKCTYYGAVMLANNPDSLGATIIERDRL